MTLRCSPTEKSVCSRQGRAILQRAALTSRAMGKQRGGTGSLKYAPTMILSRWWIFRLLARPPPVSERQFTYVNDNMMIASILHCEFAQWDDKTDRHAGRLSPYVGDARAHACVRYDTIVTRNLSYLFHSNSWIQLLSETTKSHVSIAHTYAASLSSIAQRRPSLHGRSSWLTDRQATYLLAHRLDSDGIIEREVENN